LSNEDAFGSDSVVNSAGTGSDRRMVPPFAQVGDEATASIRAVAMIAKRNIALSMYYLRCRVTSRLSCQCHLPALVLRKRERFPMAQKVN
jgi:hypothetical protein